MSTLNGWLWPTRAAGGPRTLDRLVSDPVLPVATVGYQEFYSLSGSHILANLGHSARRWIAEEYNR